MAARAARDTDDDGKTRIRAGTDRVLEVAGGVRHAAEDEVLAAGRDASRARIDGVTGVAVTLALDA